MSGADSALTHYEVSSSGFAVTCELIMSDGRRAICTAFGRDLEANKRMALKGAESMIERTTAFLKRNQTEKAD